MTTDDELQPDILSKLRDVPPISVPVREMHIAAALEQVPTSRSKRRVYLVSAAAALIVALGLGAVLQSRTPDAPAFAQREVATQGTVPAKGAAGTSLTSTCASENQKVVGSYLLDGSVAYLIDTGKGVSIATEEACSSSSFLPYPSERLNDGTDADCSPGNTWEMLLVAHLSDSQGFFYWIGINNQYLELWDCSTGTVVSQTAHPLVN